MKQPPTGFRAKKSLGQNFLNNPQIPKAMASAVQIASGDSVLEIGPGTGALTAELLARGSIVTAIETDARAIEFLRERFDAELDSGHLRLIEDDIKYTDPATLGFQEHAYKLAANIPYYLSGMLFRKFLETDAQPSAIVFLVQKEVALRVARSKKESLLSLGVKAYGTPTYVKTVSRGNFTPVPGVDSAIVTITNISHDNFSQVEDRLFFDILHLGFASKRKQLFGNLSKQFDPETLMHIFSTLSLPRTIRAEDMPLPIWLKLAASLSLHK